MQLIPLARRIPISPEKLVVQRNQAQPQSGMYTPRRLDPDRHANALIESFGVHTALEMARYYAKAPASGGYWSDVLAALTARLGQQEPAESRDPPQRR